MMAPVVAEGARDGILEEILSSLPAARFSFAYGSGAVPQNGVSSASRMLDFVVAVDRAEQWHHDNMYTRGNMDHYSNLMRFLGPKAVAAVQESTLGAKIYFNTLVPWKNGRLYKYGVITFQDLMEDLENWKTLYVSGRMQKPIHVIHSDKSVELANRKNIENAVRVALLTLPERFDETKFFERVASLSYAGDPRLKMAAEDPKKVSRIVSSNREAFRTLYRPALQRFKSIVYWDSSGKGATQDMHAKTREALLRRLPATFVARMKSYMGKEDINEIRKSSLFHQRTSSMKRYIVRKVASRGEEYCQRVLTSTMCNIVRQSSTAQMLKGVLTAGVVRSAKYAASKLRKGPVFARI